MSPQSLFNSFVKGVAEQLVGYGFERGKMVFRRVSPEGDVLIVEIQTSDHSTKAEKVFYINVALVVAPKWERDRRQYKLPNSALPEAMHGTWRRRLGSTGLSPAGDQWRIADDTSAAEVSALVRRQLDEIVPRLLPLLDRDVLLGAPPEFFASSAWLVRGWVLAQRGLSEELERLLFAEPTTHEFSSVARKAIWEYAESRSEAREGQR